MANARPIRVDIIGNARGLSATVDIANAKLSAMSKTALQASAATDRLQRNMDRANTAMAVAAGVAGAGFVFKSLADSAGAAETATLSMQAVFKGTAGQMEEAAKSANNVGMSFAQYGQNATRLGAQLQNMGFDAAGAGDATQMLIKHAADLSATFGGDATQAIEAMSAVFRKEMDPIEKYGVTMKAADIESRAAAEGITYGQAAIKTIMEQTGYAVDAFNRNADTYNVQMQKFKAATEDAKAALGRGLLPVFTGVAGTVSEVANAFADLPSGVVSTSVEILTLVGSLKLLQNGLQAAATKLAAYEAAMQTASGGSSARGLAAGLSSLGLAKVGSAGVIASIGVAIASVALAMKQYNAMIAATLPNQEEWQRSLKETGTLLNAEFDVSNAIAGMDGMRRSMADLAQYANKGILDGLIGSITGGDAQSFAATNEGIEQFAKGMEGWAAQIKLLQQAAPAKAAEEVQAMMDALAGAGLDSDQIAGELEKVGLSAQDAVAPMQAVSSAGEATAASFKAAAEGAKALREALAALGQENVDLDLAQAAYKETLRAFNEEVKKGAGVGAQSADATANLRALVAIREATLDVVAAQDQADASGGTLRATMKKGRDAFIESARAAGLGAEEARQLANDYGLIPSNVDTTVNANTTQAQARVIAIKAQLMAMAASVYATTLLVQIKTSGSSPGGVPSPGGPTRAAVPFGVGPQSRASSALSSSASSDFTKAGARAGRLFSKGWDEGLQVLVNGKTFDKLGKKAKEKAKEAWDDWLDNQQDKYDRLYDRLEKREEKLADLRREKTDFIDRVAGQVSSFSIADALKVDTSTTKSWDHIDEILRQLRAATSPGEIARLQEVYQQAIAQGPREIATGVQDIGTKLRQQLADTEKFANNIALLRARGMSKEQIQELVDAGAEAGGEMAQALVNSPELMREYQRTMNLMSKAGQRAGDILVPNKLLNDIAQMKRNISDSKKDLGDFWTKFKQDAPVKLAEKMEIRVKVTWPDGSSSTSPKNGNGRAAPLIGSLTINGAIDKEGTAREVSTVLAQHARRMGYA